MWCPLRKKSSYKKVRISINGYYSHKKYALLNKYNDEKEFLIQMEFNRAQNLQGNINNYAI
ncbi:hypothetical protein C2I06_18650 [Niallia circulans]|uniref:Uncharacterized protein n=1 Tax=Niallia circulans TaxID=1397 RepID=A0A268F7G6_NIACI|nr:hypothetical protein C2I06_18650 [Niallia circulans]AYV72872.1 hypothetical protein C2H98_15725 [Niallia circulans]PAD81331.1 hypothetical protein CHH57_20445 [Niallia circulans]